METKKLLQNAEALWAHLQQISLDLDGQAGTDLDKAQRMLAETDTVLQTLKQWVVTHSFSCWADEIFFFKTIKPRFVANFICNARIVNMLSALPAGGYRLRRKTYEKELLPLQEFAAVHRDFISYFRKGAAYMDKNYFLRFRYDLNFSLPENFHSHDERFSTSHDHLVACILANDQYEQFLRQRLSDLKLSSGRSPDTVALSWTGSKTALTELVFALHQSRTLNSGTADLSQTIRWFEQHFNISLGNYHKTMAEINLRKSHRTKFLQHLTESLHTYLDHLNA